MAQTTYPTIAQWYITNVYGVIRNEEDALKSTEAIGRIPRTVSFFRAPGRTLSNGLHRHYLVFLNVNESEASSALDIGQSLYVTWVAPWECDENSPPPLKWKGQVLPPFPGLNIYDNLLLLITRPDEDRRVLEVNEIISEQMDKARDPLWLLPEKPELAAKRLVDALNFVHDGESERHEILRRILQAMDLSRIETGNSLRQQRLYEIESDRITSLRASLSMSQRVAMDRVLDTTNFIQLVTGPFGTGKTSFIVLLTRCLKLSGKKILLCCSSNAAVDTLAYKIEEADPELKAIRFHSIFTERQAFNLKATLHRKALIKTNEAQRKEQAAEVQTNKQPTEAVDTQEDAHLAELRRTYGILIPLSIALAGKARGSRPNFSIMSLMARCLAHAGVEKEETPQSNEDPHSNFRNLFLRGDESREDFSQQFNRALDDLETDVLSSASIVLTTFSNSADKFLTKHFVPDWIIGDEAGATQEAEFLIPVSANLESVERIISVGDAQQLAPVVKSCNKKLRDGRMVNEFADSLIQPLIFRLQLAGLQPSMFLECFRCTAGLEQPSSKLFYADKIVNGPGTALNDRPRSRKTVKFLETQFGVKTTVPRLVFDLRNGVCLKGVSGSRYNLHNIAHSLQLIEMLIGEEVFDINEIAIQTPYREQNARYRAAFAKASTTSFWQDRNIWNIKLMTIDSFQGGEMPCVILYV